MDISEEATATQTEEFEEIIERGPFAIRFPAGGSLDQDEEYCEVKIDDQWKTVRFHDYGEVFKIPGLYETIFHRTLRCNSPFQVINLLGDTLSEHYVPPEELAVLDLGAGNGLVGEALQYLGIRDLVGLDITPEARDATMRDRPWVYNEYLVADLTDLSSEQKAFLDEYPLSCLTAVAALGFGDLPPRAFANAFNAICDEGWVAFNIKDDFLTQQDTTGFAGLVNRMTREGICQLEAYKRYQHRLSVAGEPLYYIAVVGQKLTDIPDGFLDAA